MRLQEIHIKNYKAFQDVVIKDIPPLAVFIGANGTGKSTLFDVLAFMRNCFHGYNVREAFQMRGGFDEVISRGNENNIPLKFSFILEEWNCSATYSINLSKKHSNQIKVSDEIFYKTDLITQEKIEGIDSLEKYSGLTQKDNEVISYIKNNYSFNLGNDGKSKLQYVAKQFFLESFFLGDFPVAGWGGFATPEETMIHDKTGKKLALFWSETTDDTKQRVLDDLQTYLPDLEQVVLSPLSRSENKLEFKAKAFNDVFQIEQLSEGSLKLFQYLLKLHNPEKSPLLCVSEPENDLYPAVLPSLMDLLDLYARENGQVFITTHSFELLNYVDLESVYILKKLPNGYTTIQKAADNPIIREQVEAGDKLGHMWQTGFFDEINP
jgi:predicted ATPase